MPPHEEHGWPPSLIRAEMAARKITLADIAREAGVSHVAVYQCIHRTHPRYKGRRIRAIIARRLGEPVQAIWPDMAAQPA